MYVFLWLFLFFLALSPSPGCFACLFHSALEKNNRPDFKRMTKEKKQLRVLNAFLEHLFLHPQPPPPTQALFQPLITTSRCAAFECDYNLHKSNSSYFSDLDVTRTHLLTCLFGRGMKTGGKNARVLIILGATHCSFKREIKPYQPYEMWSRVLCWDQKWLYVVTHFVRLGAVKPAGYTLARGGWWFWRTKQSSSASSRPAEKDVIPEKAILAVAISKYVFKQGRRTLPPETFLADCALLPPPHPLASPASPDDDNDGWTRDHVEAERIKGLRFAERFAYLDALGDTFTGADGPALGRFGDLLPGAV